MAPEFAKRQQAWEDRLAVAKKVLENYKVELAPIEAKRDEEQKAKVADLQSKLKAYEKELDGKLGAWEQARIDATGWMVLEPSELKAPKGTKLDLQDDGSILASGASKKGIYELTVDTDLPDISGIRIEALTHDSLPKNGPGRADDGNFVLTEFELFVTGSEKDAKPKKVDLQNAKADFSQNEYGVVDAINGKRGSNNEGWAVSPQLGKDHMATFEVKKPFGSLAGSKLTFKLDHNYNGNKFQLGRFRISITNDKAPLDLGTTPAIEAILTNAPSDRTPEEKLALTAYHRKIDSEWNKKSKEIGEAQKKRPKDKKLAELEGKLKKAEMPLAPDAKLVEYQHAVKLSAEQLNNARLTGAQDVAWALINNPAFLFNH